MPPRSTAPPGGLEPFPVDELLRRAGAGLNAVLRDLDADALTPRSRLLLDAFRPVQQELADLLEGVRAGLGAREAQRRVMVPRSLLAAPAPAPARADAWALHDAVIARNRHAADVARHVAEALRRGATARRLGEFAEAVDVRNRVLAKQTHRLQDL